MQNTPFQSHTQSWNAQQKCLRRILIDDKNWRRALPLLLCQHAMTHTAKLDPTVAWSFQDEVCGSLTNAQQRALPKGCAHSICWMLWHMTRIEDVTMNILLADSKQVLHTAPWLNRMGLHYEGVGNEITTAQVVALSESVNIQALFAYRLAVGKRTRTILRNLTTNTLWSRPAPERIARIVQEQAVEGSASWLLNYWGHNPTANLLLMPATRHNMVHLNEIRRILPKLPLE